MSMVDDYIKAYKQVSNPPTFRAARPDGSIKKIAWVDGQGGLYFPDPTVPHEYALALARWIINTYGEAGGS